MKIFDDIPNGRVYKFGAIYSLILTLIAAVANYFTWHASFTSIFINILISVTSIIMWIALYMPIPIFIKKAQWSFKDFGFVLNKSTIIVSSLLTALLIYRVGVMISLDYISHAFIEGFARVGEELFFRGFIFTLIFKLLQGKKHPALWAIVGSSLIFAAMHTQTFLPSNPLTMTNIFTSALLLAALRYFTGSILPGIIIHCLSNAGTLGMLVGILIYCLFVLADKLLFTSKDTSSAAAEEETTSSIS